MNNLIRSRILVVDDAPLIRGLMVQVLRKHGYIVDTAENGQQAIEMFQSQRPDLILMDADMPVLDGLAACVRIRQLPEAKHLPIIIVTSFMEGEWVDRAFTAGATDYVTKPVNWDVLRNRIHYILKAKQAEEALFKEKEKALVTLASIGDAVITTDAQGDVEFLNSVATRLTGWSNEEAKGLPLHKVFWLIDEKNHTPITFPLNRCLQAGQVIKLENNAVLKNNENKQIFAIEYSAAPIKDRNGEIIGIVLVFHDVTETRKMTQELSYRAKHDALTGLYNRHEFVLQLNNILLQDTDRKDSEHALIYMDLDQFKIVNDTCGHEAGDQLLRDVAMLLQEQINAAANAYQQAILARLGGDEFSLLLKNCELEAALEIANNMRQIIEKYRFYWNNDRQERAIFSIGISLGLVGVVMRQVNQKTILLLRSSTTQTFPLLNHLSKQDETEASTPLNQKALLAMADAACFAAKNEGRNNVHIYREDDAALVGRRKEIQWISLINDNLEREDGFTLYYQTIMPLDEHKDIGHHYEVLLRMNDQQGHLLPPGSFLSAAGRYNLMPALDRWVIRHILERLSTHLQHMEKLRLININISGYSLNDKNFLDFIINSLHELWIPAHKLCFEITETAAITNLTGARHFMMSLKRLGCCFALDDFGAGMSSMSSLRNLPLDFVKIDGSLVRGIKNDEIDRTMVASINHLVHLMGVKTIAESVENHQILNLLREIEVDYVQGYFIAEPKPLKYI